MSQTTQRTARTLKSLMCFLSTITLVRLLLPYVPPSSSLLPNIANLHFNCPLQPTSPYPHQSNRLPVLRSHSNPHFFRYGRHLRHAAPPHTRCILHRPLVLVRLHTLPSEPQTRSNLVLVGTVAHVSEPFLTAPSASCVTFSSTR